MAVATVHGQTDRLLTRKGTKLLRSVGRMFGYGHQWSVSPHRDSIQCWNGDGGIVFDSKLRDTWDEFAIQDEVQKILWDGNCLYALVEFREAGTGTNLFKVALDKQEAGAWEDIWEVRIGYGGADVHLKDMCFDHDGNLIVVGYYDYIGPGDPLYSHQLWKVNPSNGAVIWESGYPKAHECYRVAVDSNNNIFITCTRKRWGNPALQSEGVLQKYDTNGNFKWGKTSVSDSYNGRAVAVSPDDKIYFSMYRPYFDDPNYWIVTAYDSGGSVVDYLEQTSDDWHWVPEMFFDEEGYLYLIIHHINLPSHFFHLWKTDADLTGIWEKDITALLDFRLTRKDISFAHSKRFFANTFDHENRRFRDESDGSIINRGSRFWSEGTDLYSLEGIKMCLQQQFFPFGPQLCTGMRLESLYSGENSRVPVRDSGCFVRPTDPWWDNKSSTKEVYKDDIFYMQRTSSLASNPSGKFDHGLFQAKGDFNYETYTSRSNIQSERSFRRLCRVTPKPFMPYPDKDKTSVTFWYEDYRYDYVNALVFCNGKYYRCKLYTSSLPGGTPPPALYYEEVTAPNPKWDSFEGFGGLGEYDPANLEGTTPQIYTLVFHGVKDGDGGSHPLNGIYYLQKFTRNDIESTWWFRRLRPGQQSYKARFSMFANIIIPPGKTHEYSLPQSEIVLEQMWLHENNYSYYRTYHAGESIIKHDDSLIQKCYRCKVNHSGHPPPNGTYWEEQELPWDTWSSTYLFAAGEYCLRKGEWYKCVEATQIVTLAAAGYQNCTPTDIGRNVETPPETVWGKLLDYNNDTRTWYIKCEDTIPDDTYLYIPSGQGHGDTEGASTASGGAHFGVKPPNGENWEHITDDHADYPGYKTVFVASCEDNYGCMMDWKEAANETDTEDEDHIAFEGTAAVYPGAIYQYNPKKDYVTGNIVVWGGYFYKALEDDPDEPPSDAWQLLGTAAEPV